VDTRDKISLALGVSASFALTVAGFLVAPALGFLAAAVACATWFWILQVDDDTPQLAEVGEGGRVFVKVQGDPAEGLRIVTDEESPA
jgi:hypothetical protein